MNVLNRIRQSLSTFLSVKSPSWERAWRQGTEGILFQTNRLLTPYKQYTWVYIAIREIAVALSQIPIDVYSGENTTETGWLYDLIKAPNDQMNTYQLLEAIVTLLCLGGDAFMVPWVEQGRLPNHLFVFDKSNFKPKKNLDGQLEFWEYTAKNSIYFARDEIVHYKLYNPYDAIWGLSPITAGRLAMETDYASQRYNKNLIENSAEPLGVITSDEGLTRSQIEEVRENWRKRHGGAGQAGSTAILTGGLRYQQTSISQHDLQFLDSRKQNREEVLAMFQVPKSIVGITDDLNLATARQQREVFWKDTMLPYVKLIQYGFDQFCGKYAPRQKIRFDLESISELQDDYGEKVDTAVKLAKIGYPLNMINERLNLGFDEIPWGDMYYVNMNLVPIDMAGEIVLNSRNTNEPKQIGGEVKTIDILPAIHAQKTADLTYWLDFVSNVAPIEKKMVTILQRYFYQQRKALLELLFKNRKDVDDITAQFWADERGKITVVTKPPIEAAAVLGGELVAEMLGVSFDIHNPLIEQVILNRGRKITRITETVRQDVVRQLREGIRTGETINQMADRIKIYFKHVKKRALTVARTEINGAVNEAEFELAKDEGAPFKRWITAGDELVREHHARDGAIGKIPIGNIFPNSKLKHAGEFRGPPEEVINCRCNTIYVD
jgi:HK97 family phage portal protein